MREQDRGFLASFQLVPHTIHLAYGEMGLPCLLFCSPKHGEVSQLYTAFLQLLPNRNM